MLNLPSSTKTLARWAKQGLVPRPVVVQVGSTRRLAWKAETLRALAYVARRTGEGYSLTECVGEGRRSEPVPAFAASILGVEVSALEEIEAR